MDEKNGTPHQRTIGYVTISKMMASNELFRVEYREFWDKAYPDDKTKPCEMHLYIYTMAIADSSRTGLYADMKFFAKDFNYRNTHAVKSQVHAMPEHGKPAIRKSRPNPKGQKLIHQLVNQAR